MDDHVQVSNLAGSADRVLKVPVSLAVGFPGRELVQQLGDGDGRRRRDAPTGGSDWTWIDSASVFSLTQNVCLYARDILCSTWL